MAIEAKELRIGNILEDHGEYLPVGFDTFKYWDKFNFGEFLKPVILSEEILFKSGWFKIPTFNIIGSFTYDLGRNRSLSIGCVGTPNEMLFLREGNGSPADDLICIHNFDYDGRLYLHKLQNIVSIFGKELTINL